MTAQTAAQAMAMTDLGAWMAEMDATISQKSSGERVAALRSVTSLFVTQSTVLSEDSVALFDDVFMRLVDEVGQAAQVDLSERIAIIPNAPLRTVRALANGPIEVAKPVLTQSPRISDTELVEIVNAHGDAHRLAITKRRALSPLVTDALVERGSQEVLRSVAGNAGAAFSDRGMSTLVARSERDEELQITIGRRSDVADHHLDELIARASDKVRESIMPHLPEAKRAAMAAVLARATQTVVEALRKQQIDYKTAKTDVDELLRANALTQDHVVHFAKHGHVGHVVAGLAALTRLPISLVEGVIVGDKTESVLILCRSLDFRWTSTRPVVQMGRPPFGEAEIEALSTAYNRMTQMTAGRIVRFLAVQQAAAKD